MAFRFNEEQSAILDHLHYRDSQILAVNALAGTGKTTTLKGAAQYPLERERIRYFVFNKRNADEAQAEFPRNTTVSTAHSFAFRSPHPDGGGTMAEVYGGSQPRLFSGSLYGPLRDQMRQSTEFADRIRQIRQELRCSEGRVIMAVQSILRQYCQSADEQIGPQHIAPDLADYIHRQGLQGTPKATLGTAAWAWDRMRDPFSQFPIDHGGYLKLCSLAPPRIPADTILFDEAQDASPPMLAILKAQLQYGTRLVLVGDTYQHIYDFTGAVDAMKVMREDHPELTTTLPLATSYRFGQDVADAGNHFLRLMGSPYLLVGKGPDSRVVDDQIGTVHAVLFRGNAGLLQAAVQAVVAGQRIHVVGGTGEIVNLVEAMGRLYKSEFAKHPELSFFDNWFQLAEYAQTPLGSGLAPLVKIVEQNHGRVEDIAQALRNTETDPSRAQYVLSTGHKSKGGQWNNVLLMDDFQRSWLNTDEEVSRQYQVPGEDALCLQYVACTRAQTTLYTNGLLDTMERALQEERDYGTAPKVLRERIPEVLAGLEAWQNPSASIQDSSETSATGNLWQPVEYGHAGTRLVVDGTRPPFDENPILLHTRFGVIEASWVPSEGHGEDAEGFYFEDAHGKIYDLDDVRFWHPLPDITYSVDQLPGFAPYQEEKPLLIRDKDKGWVEAWFDKELGVWQALDAFFTVDPESVIAFAPLPEPPAAAPENRVQVSLREIEPYSLAWLLGDESARDSTKDPEFSPDYAEWVAVRERFADHLDAILAARLGELGAALQAHGWQADSGGYRQGDATLHLRLLPDRRGIEARTETGAIHWDQLRLPPEQMAAKLTTQLHGTQPARLFALAESVEAARAGAFVDGPNPDKNELAAFGRAGTFLVELARNRDPVILGQLTEENRKAFLPSGADDPLAKIDPVVPDDPPVSGYLSPPVDVE